MVSAKTRNTFNRPLKSQNPDLYYYYLQIEYYYFYQQYKVHFVVTELPDYKCILFAIGFLNNNIINCW